MKERNETYPEEITAIFGGAPLVEDVREGAVNAVVFFIIAILRPGGRGEVPVVRAVFGIFVVFGFTLWRL